MVASAEDGSSKWLGVVADLYRANQCEMSKSRAVWIYVLLRLQSAQNEEPEVTHSSKGESFHQTLL